MLTQRISDDQYSNPNNDDASKALNLKEKTVIIGSRLLTRASFNVLNPTTDMKGKKRNYVTSMAYKILIDRRTMPQLGTSIKDEEMDSQFVASKRISTRKRQLPAFLKSYNL